MKKLLRRLSKIGDTTSTYSLLRSDSSSAAAASARRPRRVDSFRAAAAKIRRSTAFPGVPHGHVPVYVGDEMERFVVSAELLNHPVLAGLLDRSAAEYGYEQKGALRIPCHVIVFERVLEALRLGDEDARDIHELFAGLSVDDSCFC